MRARLVMSALGGLLPLGALFLVPSIAHAQGADTALAESLFQEGKRLMNEGKPQEGCPKLAESYRLDPGLGTLLNLATCHEAEGKIATAWAEFNEALSRAKRESDTPRQDLAASKVAALGPRLRRVVIVVPKEASTPGLEVKLDGSRVAEAAWGLPVPIDPGVHEFAASAPGKQPWVEKREAPPEAQTLSIPIPVLTDAAAPVTPVTPEPVTKTKDHTPEPKPESPSRFSVPVIVAASATGLFTIGAIVTGVLYSGAHSDFEEANEDRADDRFEKRDEAKTLGVVNLVCIGGAVVSAGIAVTLYLTNSPKAEAPKGATLELFPSVGPTGAGLGARGRF